MQLNDTSGSGTLPSSQLCRYLTETICHPSFSPTVQIFDRDKALKRSLYLASPIKCCCYLNDEGDILIGLQSKLVVVLADTYQWLGKAEDGAARVSIYDGLRGRGTRPSNRHRADTCPLQRLSTARPPMHQ